MKIKIAIIIYLPFLLGCISSKEVNDLLLDKRILFPIGENNKWGFANDAGETVIAPIYDEVEFFSKGIAVVKKDDKFGFIKKDGTWHLPPKYNSATSFFTNWSRVSIEKDTFYINTKGRKIKKRELIPRDAGGCIIIPPADPEKYFIKLDEEFNLVYKFYLQIDSTAFEEIKDTISLGIDEVIPFGFTHILLKKEGKYGLLDIWNIKIIIDQNISIDPIKDARDRVSALVEFNYDEVTFERYFGNEARNAKVRIGERYGVIDNRGNPILNVEFYSLEFQPRWNMALVEYEPNRFGYKTFKGKEYFKRIVSSH